MQHKAEDGESGFARLSRLLNEVNLEAEKLDMPLIVHLSNMALMQLTLDWDGAEPEQADTAGMGAVFQETSQLLPFKRPQVTSS